MIHFGARVPIAAAVSVPKNLTSIFSRHNIVYTFRVHITRPVYRKHILLLLYNSLGTYREILL